MKTNILNFLNPSKRLNRVSFVVAYLIYLVGFAAIYLTIELIINVSFHYDIDNAAVGTISSLVVSTIYFLIWFKKRANDISGKNAWLIFAFCTAMPLVVLAVTPPEGFGFLMLEIIALIFIPSEKKANKYGPVPGKGIHFN